MPSAGARFLMSRGKGEGSDTPAAYVLPPAGWEVLLGVFRIAGHEDPEDDVGQDLRPRKNKRGNDQEADDKRVPLVPPGKACGDTRNPLSATRTGKTALREPRPRSGDRGITGIGLNVHVG